MVEKNEIANVWYIDGNELKNGNKVISKVVYDGIEFAVLKSKKDWIYADMLIKDKNNDNMYWELGTAPIKFQKIVTGCIDNTIPEIKEYCEALKKEVLNLNLKKSFIRKITSDKYFNKCELKYIATHIPELYSKAMKSREKHIEKLNLQKQIEKEEIEKYNQEKVKTTNEICEDKINDIKEKIHLCETVKSEDLEFYKDEDYHNGHTIQNCFLYLANEYGVNIPLATKGYINNRLDKYNFGTGRYTITRAKNNNASSKLNECFDKIKNKVDEEYKRNKEKIKDKKIKDYR